MLHITHSHLRLIGQVLVIGAVIDGMRRINHLLDDEVARLRREYPAFDFPGPHFYSIQRPIQPEPHPHYYKPSLKVLRTNELRARNIPSSQN